MIYIFEGADLTGKSFLANAFAKKYNLPIIKKRLDLLEMDREKLKGSEIERITHFFFESIFPLGKQYDFILDRSLLSSLAFSKFFDRDYNLDYIYKFFLDPEFAQYITCFFIYSPEDLFVTRLENRIEKFFTLNEIILLQNQYFNLVNFLWTKNANNIYNYINREEGDADFLQFVSNLGIKH